MKLSVEDSPHGNWTIMIKLGTWNDKSNDMDEILLFQWNWQHEQKKIHEFGDRNKIDHMDGIWTILLKSIKCM